MTPGCEVDGEVTTDGRAETDCGAGMICVQTVAQVDAVAPSAGCVAPWPLIRQEHRVAAGITIRALLCGAGLRQLIGPIESGAMGLACHGRRAWLDDVLVDGSRVEIVAPVTADARAERARKVAAQRRRRAAQVGIRR